MRSLLLIFVVGFLPFPGLARAAPETRIDQLLAAMTLEEKVSFVSGNDFDTHGVPRLGIPPIKMTDGPLGVRRGPNTAFPSGISMGASFNPALVKAAAAAIADEARFLGRNMLLGPCVNISRQPFGGRNFESFGEDPYLTARLAENYILGVQGENVIASVKHFAANDQEWQRTTINVNVDTRALFEIHLPAFEAAVNAGSWSVMSAYNKINGAWASENEPLLQGILKRRWGFRGFVVSDWESTHDTLRTANHGLDLEMPYGTFWGDHLLAAVRSGEVAESTLDDKVRRILRAMLAVGILDGSLVAPAPAPAGPESAAHRALALQVAQESLVLLKNEGRILPLADHKKIAVLGPNADFYRSGGGSSEVPPYAASTPLDALRERLGSSAELVYAPGVMLPGDFLGIPKRFAKPELGSVAEGLRAEFFDNKEFTGSPFLTRLDEEARIPGLRDAGDPRFGEHFAARWTGYLFFERSGEYRLSTWSDDGARLFLDGKEILSHWDAHGPAADSAVVSITEPGWHSFRAEYFQAGGGAVLRLGWETPGHELLGEALAAARSADVAVVFAGLGNNMESEGIDRSSLSLPEGQADFIRAVAQVNPNVVVVLNSGNPVTMGEWLPNARAVVQAWYPGQEGGYAVADALLGRINPSGKSPVSFLKRWEDSPAYANYPGEAGQAHYDEGIFVGYRHFDARKIDPEFPFGHGLSYTTFSYRNLRVTMENPHALSPAARVEFDLRNEGTVAGAEVAQLYIGELAPPVPRPVRELKGFEKVFLQPGESRHLVMKLDQRSFAYFEPASMSWKAAPGAYRLEIGASSRDLRLIQELKLLD